MPDIIVKKDVKRDSIIRLDGLAWIAHLHRLWIVPRDGRRRAPRALS